MTRIVSTPTTHSVWNEFDKFGLLLGLSRLSGEDNVSYKRRLVDVFVNRANATYRGLINGITRELGLSISEVLRVKPVLDSSDEPLVDMPAIVFQDTKCYLYNDYASGDILLTMDRYDLDDGYWTIEALSTAINNTGKYTSTIIDTDKNTARSMSIFNQSSIETIVAEDISNAGGRFHLQNNNLISGSVAITSPNLNRRVSDTSSLSKNGDYYIDLPNGIIYMLGQSATGSVIRYQYRNDDFTILSSPVIIHNLQSDDFKTKMFEQILADDSNTVNGRPTDLGVDLINELLSVYPISYGI